MVSDPEQAAAARAADVRARVGHPQELWDAIVDRVQAEALTNFEDITDDWLGLMWCLDQYRVADAPPAGMGQLGKPWDTRLEGAYRSKGNWFATLLSLLLDNRTGQKIRSRNKIKGFSQVHQIDLAWPDRDIAPIVCAESKVTGGPAYRNYPARGAMSDWSNRRKELKFAATDLKLSRRDQTDKIGHWSVWRQDAAPKAFMLWGARLRPIDKVERMIKEVEVVLATYLDGAGIVAWRENDSGTGYVAAPLPPSPHVESLDVALWRIESEIGKAIARGALHETVTPAAPVDPAELVGDDADNESA
ncbi:MAG: hypothetical protein V7607_2640 [Solirubrobacteraceae bacterium]